LRLKDLEEKVVELNEALEREKEKKSNEAINELAEESPAKGQVESRCPSYMNDS
jgi:hypothetical protein